VPDSALPHVKALNHGLTAPAFPQQWHPVLLMLGLNVLWSITLVASKIGINQFPPLLFSSLRFLVFALPLVRFLRWYPGQMLRLLATAMLTGGLAVALLSAGIKYSGDISATAIATQLTVPFTTLLSIWLLGEVVHWRRWTGIIISLLGIGLLSFDPHMFDHRFGLALVIVSSGLGALGLIMVKRHAGGLGTLQLQALIAWSGLALMLPLTLILESGQLTALAHADYRGWSAVLITALLGNLTAHSGFYTLVRSHPISRLAPLNVVSPILTVMLGVLLLGDRMTARGIVGGVLVLAGVLIIAIREGNIVDAPL
jgi:O-acetylserine/cysteine efflux transporter